MDLIAAADVLEFVGRGTAPTAEETARAVDAAAAINAGITTRLDWPATRVATAGETAELTEAAKVAAGELWRRREAPFGVTGYADAMGAAIRVARDPLEAIAPVLNRHRDGAAGNFG